VWLLNHYANPPGFPGGARHHSLAYWLPAARWRATLLVSSIVHHSDEQLLPDGVGRALEVHDGVPYLRLRVPPCAGNSVQRVMNMAAYCARALDPRNRGLVARPDLVIGSSVHPFAALSGAMLARRYGVPFVFEVRDLWPETLIARGSLAEDAAASRVFRALERTLYRQASYTVTLLPHAHEYIGQYGIPADRVVWIPNGVDWRAYDEAPAPVQKDTFDFMYFGAHGISNDLDVLIRAFHQFEQRYDGDRAVRLRLIGDGPSKPGLVELAAELGVRDVSFESAIPRGDVPALAAEADAFVVVVGDLPRLYRYGISLNKLYEYMAAGRPVVCAAAAGNDPVAEAGAGLSVPPADGPLCEAMLEMVAMEPARRAAMGDAARQFIRENHDYRLLARRLADLMDRAIVGAR